MRQGWFPPFGFEFSEFGLREPFKTPFWAFFDFRKKSVLEIRVQKDAPGPVSPLRVRIFGVWAPGASFGPVFDVFRFSFCFDLFSFFSGYVFGGCRVAAMHPLIRNCNKKLSRVTDPRVSFLSCRIS